MTRYLVRLSRYSPKLRVLLETAVFSLTGSFIRKARPPATPCAGCNACGSVSTLHLEHRSGNRRRQPARILRRGERSGSRGCVRSVGSDFLLISADGTVQFSRQLVELFSLAHGLCSEKVT